MTDSDDLRKMYLSAIGYVDTKELIEENTRLKNELDALQKRLDRILLSMQDSIDSILRVAREGKSDT
jgi:regulator of replication initiation timing